MEIAIIVTRIITVMKIVKWYDELEKRKILQKMCQINRTKKIQVKQVWLQIKHQKKLR